MLTANNSATGGALKKPGIKEGVVAGVPVFAGYFPIAVTFGLLAVSVKMTLAGTFCFSAIVFAGASQFMGLTMLGSGAGSGEIVLAAFLLNFRHFLMSASLSSRASFNKKLIPFIAFGITDETFSVASMRAGGVSERFLLGLNFTAYAGWVSGTVAGFAAGNFLPAIVQESISICLYAMFAALLVPAVKKSLKAGAIALAAGFINSVLAYFSLCGAGWGIVVSILFASTAGMILFGEE